MQVKNCFTKSVCLTIAFAVISPNVIAAKPLSLDDITRCIDAYDASHILHQELLNKDLMVISEYSHFEIADKKVLDAEKLQDSLLAKVSTMRKRGSDYINAIAEIEQAKVFQAKWSAVARESLTVTKDLMYGQKLKTDRLRNLRSTLLRCKDEKFSRKHIKTICKTMSKSMWCEGRF